MIALRILGYLWAAPLVLGLAFAPHAAVPLPLLVFALLWALGQVRPLGWSEGAWEWGVVPLSWLDRRRGRWTGVTCGWLILYAPEAHRWPWIRAHEREHLRQGLVLGPLLPVLYGLAALAAVAAGARAYEDNPFEVAAKRAGDAAERS